MATIVQKHLGGQWDVPALFTFCGWKISPTDQTKGVKSNEEKEFHTRGIAVKQQRNKNK